MRIAYPFPFGPYGVASTGGGIHVERFLENASKLGHEVFTFGLRQDDDLRIPGDRWRRTRFLRTMDAIYYRTEGHFPAPDKWFSSPYFDLIGRPLVVWEFNTVPEYHGPGGQATEGVAGTIRKFRSRARRCDVAICVSEVLSKYVRQRLNIANTVTIPNGAEPSEFEGPLSPPDRVKRDANTLNVFWMGTSLHSDFQFLRDVAIRLWRADYRDIAFHLVGDAACLSKVLSKTPPSVVYHGQVPHREIPDWLSAMDIGLFLYKDGPTKYGSPMKLFDYLAGGLAIAGIWQDQVGEICGELGMADFLVRPEEPDRLVETLIEMNGNREMLRSLGEAGRRLVRERFTWRHNAERTFEALERARRERFTKAG